MTSDLPVNKAARMAVLGRIIGQSVFCFLVLFSYSQAIAYDSSYLLREGKNAFDEGMLSEAQAFLEEYIDTHPTTLGDESSAYRKRKQYYIRNLLTAYDDLFAVYRETGNVEAFQLKIALLKTTFLNGGFSDKNLYNLAEIYLEMDHLEEAVELLKQIVGHHAANHYPANVKVTLRASSKLLDIYRAKGQAGEADSLLQVLKDNYPDPSFDTNDRYKLAQLYLDNGHPGRGVLLLKEIAEREVFDYRSPFIYTLTRTYVKLLHISHKKGEVEYKNNLLARLDSAGIDKLSPGNSYRLAIALLNAGEPVRGRKILDGLSSNFQGTVWARKSLFVLARDAMSKRDWEKAIDKYAAYVERYPDQTFFALKAYASLLDAYWARNGDLREQQIEVGYFADIINEVADYDIQLNLARDLRRKGFNRLANATFVLGQGKAKQVIDDSPESLAAMRAKWLITKYAVELEKYDLALENGNSLVEQNRNNGKSSLRSRRERERAEYYLSRTYLWLAEINELLGTSERAAEMLNCFINEFPGDKDADYARYKLGILYEQNSRFADAAEMFRRVKDERLQEKIRQHTLSGGAQ